MPHITGLTLLVKEVITGEAIHSFGVTYIRPVSNRFHVEIGIEYLKSTFRFSTASISPEERPEPRNTNFSLIEIPITARFNFWQYFFLNGGFLLGFDITDQKHLDNQTGVGAVLGVGAKYDFKNTPIGLFINPYVKHRPLIPLSERRNYHLRTAEAGFRVGAVYNF